MTAAPEDLVAILTAALRSMVAAHPTLSRPIGAPGSPARAQQEDQAAAVVEARSALDLLAGAPPAPGSPEDLVRTLATVTRAHLSRGRSRLSVIEVLNALGVSAALVLAGTGCDPVAVEAFAKAMSAQFAALGEPASVALTIAKGRKQ